MIFFFDKTIGVTIPKVLMRLSLPVGIEYHETHFNTDEKDDDWLPIVGKWEWFVIGHDEKYHKRENELFALKQYHIGCFYLWGANAPKWEKMRVFARAYDKIVTVAANAARPFVYEVDSGGRLKSIPIL